MVHRLEKLLTVLTSLAAIAYSLGWVKTSSYFETFGIGLSQLDMTIQDYLFESWFVIENIVFFILLSGVLLAGFRLKLRRTGSRIAWRLLLGVSGLVYVAYPLTTHWAFARLSYWWLDRLWFFSQYYSALKFIPFVLYALLVVAGWPMFFAKGRREEPEELEKLFRVPARHHLVFLYVVVLLGWSISLAKHIGTIDAIKILRSPAASLSRIVLHTSSSDSQLKDLEANKYILYSLYESPKKYFIWDATKFDFTDVNKWDDCKKHSSPPDVPGKCPAPQARILIIPREKVDWVEVKKELYIDPGSLFF